MSDSFFPNLVVVDHPLVRDKVTRLRSVNTGTRRFRVLTRQLAVMVAQEATRELPEEAREVETPLELAMGSRVPPGSVAVVPILRAGLGMAEAFELLAPGATVGHVGMARDHDTLRPVEYYFHVPSDLSSRTVFVLDPMLGTGGTAVATLAGLKRRGARLIKLVCLVAAPEGVLAVQLAHPDVPVYTAALDRELDERGYILPGLGDAGDRFFGTGGTSAG